MFALVMRHAQSMRGIMLSSVACLAVPYLFHIISPRAYFRGGGKLLNIKRVL